MGVVDHKGEQPNDVYRLVSIVGGKKCVKNDQKRALERLLKVEEANKPLTCPEICIENYNYT